MRNDDDRMKDNKRQLFEIFQLDKCHLSYIYIFQIGERKHQIRRFNYFRNNLITLLFNLQI